MLLMSAMIAIIIKEKLYDAVFIEQHTHGFEEVKAAFNHVPIEDYIAKADVPVDLIYQVVQDFSKAKRLCTYRFRYSTYFEYNIKWLFRKAFILTDRELWKTGYQ